jgi:hypothetical protein
MQWSTISSGRFSHNEAYNKYVTDFVSGVVAAMKSRLLKWQDFNRQETNSHNAAHECWKASV